MATQPPRIALPTYGRDERNRFTLYGEYIDAVRRAGGVPLLLPPGEERLDVWLELADGWILCGGGDLDPATHGGVPAETNYGVDPERDATELALVRRLIDEGRPTLCICRGLQVLNTALGGTLIAHLPDEVGEAVPHRLPPREPVRHPVSVQAGSRLAEVLGTTSPAPFSWHHQAVGELAPGLEVVARAPDGVVEAAALASRPALLAVQWHPELSAATDPDQQRLFDDLVAQAAASRSSDPASERSR